MKKGVPGPGQYAPEKTHQVRKPVPSAAFALPKGGKKIAATLHGVPLPPGNSKQPTDGFQIPGPGAYNPEQSLTRGPGGPAKGSFIPRKTARPVPGSNLKPLFPQDSRPRFASPAAAEAAAKAGVTPGPGEYNVVKSIAPPVRRAHQRNLYTTTTAAAKT